jgi:hypothetical protein
MNIKPQGTIIFTALLIIVGVVGVNVLSHFGFIDNNLAGNLTNMALAASGGGGVAYGHDVVKGE